MTLFCGHIFDDLVRTNLGEKYIALWPLHNKKPPRVLNIFNVKQQQRDVHNGVLGPLG